MKQAVRNRILLALNSPGRNMIIECGGKYEILHVVERILGMICMQAETKSFSFNPVEKEIPSLLDKHDIVIVDNFDSMSTNTQQFILNTIKVISDTQSMKKIIIIGWEGVFKHVATLDYDVLNHVEVMLLGRDRE